jgi:hypothetical protein
MPFTKLCHRNNSKGERVYFVRYYVTGNRGNERKFTIGQVSPRRAKEISERIRAMVIQGVDPQNFYKEQAVKNINEAPKRLRLADLEDTYLKYCNITNRPATIIIKETAYKSLRKFLGNCDIDTVTPEKIEAWMTSLTKITKTTVNIKLRQIRSMFNWGVKRGLLTYNPFVNSGIKQYVAHCQTCAGDRRQTVGIDGFDWQRYRLGKLQNPFQRTNHKNRSKKVCPLASKCG